MQNKKALWIGCLGLLFSSGLWAGPSPSPTVDTHQVISDPSISERCRELLKKRQEKISVKQRLASLVKRTEKAIELCKDKRPTAKKKLQYTLSKLNQEHMITSVKIKNLEEDLVRKGCPGILL